MNFKIIFNCFQQLKKLTRSRQTEYKAMNLKSIYYTMITKEILPTALVKRFFYISACL